MLIYLSEYQGGKPQVADFVHGSDGIGNIPVPDPTTKKAEQTAAEFLVDKVARFPGEVSVLALGPLTNVALVSNCSLFPPEHLLTKFSFRLCELCW
jgi:inosine-uridine nucleoside N-ribohydrolase